MKSVSQTHEQVFITILISVFQWQTESSIENFYLSVGCFLSLSTENEGSEDSEGYHSIAKPRGGETHYWSNEPVCPSSRARNLTGWNLELMTDDVACAHQGGGGTERDLDQLGERRGWGEGDWIWLQGRRNCFLDARLSESLSVSLFPRYVSLIVSQYDSLNFNLIGTWWK